MFAPHVLKKYIRGLKEECGLALPTALVLLVLGSLIVISTVLFVGTNLKATRVIDDLDLEFYAADSGIDFAIWNLKYNEQIVLPDEGDDPLELIFPESINDKIVTVDITNVGDNGYKITSTATSQDGTSTSIEVNVVITPGSFSAFDNAAVSLDGDIVMTGNSRIYSDGGGEGDAYANGDIDMTGDASIDGDGNATGTIHTEGTSHIDGNENPNADPIDVDAITSAMNIIINEGKSAVQDVECATCGSYTYTGNTWTPPAGTYSGAQHAKNYMTISDVYGTWVFKNNVCVGVNTNRDMKLSGGGDITFEGPVKVGRKLNISAWAGTIIFKDSVCVISDDLDITGGATIIFEGPVYVGEDMEISASNTRPVFYDTVYVGDDLKIEEGQGADFYNVVYAADEIKVEDDAVVMFAQNVIADGEISFKGYSKINEGMDAENLPFIISTGEDIDIGGSNTTAALLYSPTERIELSGNSKLYGVAIGDNVKLTGNAVIEYPEELRNRLDLPGDPGGEGGMEIRSYTVR